MNKNFSMLEKQERFNMKLAKLIKQFIQDHPVGAYFLMVFAIGWFGTVLVGIPKLFRGEAIELLDIVMMSLGMFASPILSGILVAFVVDGKRGIGDMFSRMKLWRVGKWYLTLLIFPVLILVVSYLLSATVSPEFAPVFLFGNIVMGILAGFLEEPGWMGFAFPKMKEQHGIIRATVYLGFLHGLWHFAIWFVMIYPELGGYFFPCFIAFALIMVALRVIMAWAYSRTESLLLSQLIHVSSTGFLWVFMPQYNEPVNEVIFYVVYAIFLWVVALVAIRKMAGASS